MSRKPTIKWRSSDAEKLENEIRRFNAKIYRTKRAHPEMADILPNAILKKDKKLLIKNLKETPRNEFNNLLKSLDRFSVKGAEIAITSKTGNTVTTWELKETKKKFQRSERMKAKELEIIKAINVTSRGESLELKRGEMGSERLNGFQPRTFDFDKIQKGTEWEKFKKYVDKHSSQQNQDKLNALYKENYLLSLDNFGGYADDIKDIINQLPNELMVETYYGEQEATIEFVYTGVDGLQAKEFIIETVRGIWQKTLDEYKNSNAQING